MATISVDSSELQDIVSRLNSDNESLDEMSTSFKEDFVAIKNAGLFEKQFKIIQDKLDLITEIYGTVSNELGEHLTVYSAVEDKVSQYANDYMSYYSYNGGYRGGNSSNNSTSSEPTTLGLNSEFLKDGILDEEIKEIDSKTLVSLINFINQNKSNQYMSINEMMLDDNYSQELVNLIQQYYTTKRLENLEITDETAVIAEFLKQILTTDVELTADLKDNSIIGYKEFLASIAEKNNTDIYTLLTDPQYQEILAVYLANLYNGDIGDTGVDYNSEYIENFKTIVDKKVEANNIQIEEIFLNPLYLI